MRMQDCSPASAISGQGLGRIAKLAIFSTAANSCQTVVENLGLKSLKRWGK